MIVLPPLSLLQRGGVHATHLLTTCYYHYYYWGCCTKKAKSGKISKLPITSPPRWELLPIIPIFKEHPLLLWPILLLNFYYYHYTVTTITAVTTITTWYHYYYHHLSANYFVIHLIHLGRYQQTPDMVIPRQSPLLLEKTKRDLDKEFLQITQNHHSPIISGCRPLFWCKYSCDFWCKYSWVFMQIFVSFYANILVTFEF